MSDTQAIQTKTNQVLEQATRTQDNETEVNYQQLQGNVHELEALAREGFQTKVKDQCGPILTKLENNVPLSEEEQKTVRLLLIGDADYYLEGEDNLDQWRDDVVRLVGEIEQLQSSDVTTVDNLMRLQAICREAMRILPNLAFYFRQQERVRNFENTIREPISSETKQVAADLIRAMIGSDSL